MSCMKQCQLHNKHSVTITVYATLNEYSIAITNTRPVSFLVFIYAVFTKLIFKRSNTYVSVLPISILMNFSCIRFHNRHTVNEHFSVV